MKTVPELASQYEIYPTMINGWKHQLLEEASTLFASTKGKGKQEPDTHAQIDELYRQIGQLKVRRDFLAKRSANLDLGNERRWSMTG